MAAMTTEGGTTNKTNAAAATAARGTKRRLEGYGGDSGVTVEVSPKIVIVHDKTVHPTGGTEGSYRFDIKAAHNEFIR
jgi:hypothetical protein